MSRMTDPTEPTSGTLLWVGPRKQAEFCDVYQFCEDTAAQISVRCDLEDAFFRTSTDVQAIVIAHDERVPIEVEAVQSLCHARNCNDIVLLRGPLCDTQRHTKVDFPSTSWNRWKEVLPAMLMRCGYQPQTQAKRAQSVAVVASTLAAADPLMDLVATCGATAVWCRAGSSSRARNFDVVWWDDSVADPCGPQEWQQRIHTFDVDAQRKKSHHWIANGPQPQQVTAAKLGGIEEVFCKPLAIGALLATVETFEPVELEILHNRAA